MNRNIKLGISVFGMLFAGIIYSWSILKNPFVAEYGWNSTQLSLNFTITMCCFSLGGLVSGFLLKKVGPKIIICLGALFAGAGFVSTSFNTGSLQTLYLTYGLLAGLGIGMANNALVTSTNAIFPDKRGFSAGCLMFGFGASSLILGTIADKLMSGSFGWRNTYRLIGILTIIFLSVAGLLASLPQSTNGNKKESSNNVTTGEMLKGSTFYVLYLYSIALCAVGNVIISAAKDICISFNATASLATTLVGILALCNGCGRLLSGYLYDKVGKKGAISTGSCFAIVGPVCIIISIMTKIVPLGILGICLVGLSYGFSPTLSSSLTGELFGLKYFSSNFSIVSTMMIPTSFVATFAGKIVQTTGSYQMVMILLTGFAVISLLLGLQVAKK